MRRLIERIAIVVAFTTVVACGSLACGSRAPTVTFTEIPLAAVGGDVRTATIAGRVDGARPGDRIVLFAKSGQWYVQPLRTKPFTEIDAQGRWQSPIHLGSDYAALVVRDGYRPPNMTKALPGVSAKVAAIAIVKGSGGYSTGPVPPLQFSGYDWDVRHVPSDRGGRNLYSPDNVKVGADGALQLSVARRGDQWTCAGVCLTRPLGYGTYVFIVRDMTGVDPAARLALFTYDESGRAVHFREMNIDLWNGDQPGTWGGQFVVQPNYLPNNLHRFAVPAGRVSYTLRWEPGVAEFKSMRDNFLEQPGAAIASQTFTTGVPTPGKERVCMAFYCYWKGGREPRADTTIAIERFQYLP